MLRLAMAVLLASMGFAANAADHEDIRKGLAKLIPNAEPDAIEQSVLPGFYEVTYGLDVYYVSKDARYFINGAIMDLVEEKNITEDKKTKARLELISSLDEKDMIIFSPEKPKHKLTVFTDIDCGYCRKLHREMDKLNELGIAVRYMMFPRAGKNSKSYEKAVSAWCSDDQQKALTEAKAGNEIEKKTCDNPVDKHMELVRKLGISGTPTIILEDGSVIPGYVPAERLFAALEGEEQ